MRMTSTTYDSLAHSFRVVAFVDVLGWSALTGGIDTLTLRKMARKASLSPEERAEAERLAVQMQRARQLDGTVSQVIRDLRALAKPLESVVGEPGAVRFWQNRHITFVRFSDNVFLHSSSPKWVVLFLSELLKRGLERGLLFRAGLSAGAMVHEEPGSDPDLDPRSRDVSLFGDAITTAVAAEKAGSGRGVRAFVHQRLADLLGDDLSFLLRPTETCDRCVKHELAWWSDFRDRWPRTGGTEIATRTTEEWLERMRESLLHDAMYEWNRNSTHGSKRLEDTEHLLGTILAERAAGAG